METTLIWNRYSEKKPENREFIKHIVFYPEKDESEKIYTLNATPSLMEMLYQDYGHDFYWAEIITPAITETV